MAGTRDAARRALGAWYTPDDLVDRTVEAALGPVVRARTAAELDRLRILDPACGDGAFLRGVARFLDRLPARPRALVAGVDVDPAAAAAAGAQARCADWLVGPPEAPPWDVIVGNPPWAGVRAMTRSRRQELADRHVTAVGQFDLMGLFVERTLASLAPGGRAALLLPDRWLLNPEGEPLRRHVLARADVYVADRLGEGCFPGVAMPALLLAFGRRARRPDGAALPLRRYLSWDEARIPLHLTDAEVARAEALLRAGVRLGALVAHGRGVEVGRTSPHVRREPGPDTAPILFGQDVDRYRLGPGRHLALHVPSLRYKAPSLYAAPKILLRKTGTGVRAALDRTDRLVSQVVYVLRPRAGEAAWLLGVLNSAPFAFLHRARNGEADKRTFPHLRQCDVLSLPVPASASARCRAAISALAGRRMDGGPETLDPEIDALVESAYAECVGESG